ncbi:MAG: hypothetical protein M1819_001311 [Sarea resinae]|nr:MAG: hypothetical protein M1819_001311 [Sarea resinae]
MSPARRIMSLKQPHLKMSKSHEDPMSRILITDNHETIRRKIKFALTDSISGVSYNPVDRPGVSNLIEILFHLEGRAKSCEDLATEFKSLSIRTFKEIIADRVAGRLSGIGSEYQRILEADSGRYLDYIANKGAEKARASAEATMALAREAVGLD